MGQRSQLHTETQLQDQPTAGTAADEILAAYHQFHAEILTIKAHLEESLLRFETRLVELQQKYSEKLVA